MDEFLKMDIFFAVTTVAVVVLTLLVLVIGIRLLRIMKNIENISNLVEAEGEELREDIAHVRASVKEEGVRIGHLLGLLSLLKKRPRSSKRT